MVNVLLVDDDMDIRSALIMALCLYGKDFSAIEACEGGEAIAIIEKASPPIDIVITDLNMAPGLSGLELISWMKARGLKTPILMLTAHEPKNSGADIVLQKPPDFGLLTVSFLGLLEKIKNQ